MIGLDTNILLRAIAQDNPAETIAAKNLLSGLTSERQGIINPIVLAELSWALRTRYGYERLEIIAIVDNMLQSQAYFFTDRQAVNEAISRCRDESMHFADALIGELNRQAGAMATMTFDKNASKSDAFTLLVT
jgi:predicted nucleic-acid-binding protein